MPRRSGLTADGSSTSPLRMLFHFRAQCLHAVHKCDLFACLLCVTVSLCVRWYVRCVGLVSADGPRDTSSCYVSQGMVVKKLSNSKSDHQGHSRALAVAPFDRISYSIPLQLCIYIALFITYFPKFKEVT